MANLKCTSLKVTSLLSVAAIVLCSVTAMAQNATDICRPAPVVPRASGSEPPAKIVIDPPLAEPLASRGVVVIQYCAQNLHIVPVFGPNALAVSPRIGHIHVRLDDASWVWADGVVTQSRIWSCSSRNTASHQLIVMGLIAHTCVEATVRYAAELGYEVTMVKDATEDYSDEEMHAALDVNIPNYATTIVNTNEVVDAISSLSTVGISMGH